MNKKLKTYKVVYRRGRIGQENWIVGEDDLREFITTAYSKAEAVIKLINLDFAYEVAYVVERIKDEVES
jgi:hypothetical protein